ncbi:hypothetical protein Droror1_Dr00018049, partial [Drosera rotundifolia]
MVGGVGSWFRVHDLSSFFLWSSVARRGGSSVDLVMQVNLNSTSPVDLVSEIVTILRYLPLHGLWPRPDTAITSLI